MQHKTESWYNMKKLFLSSSFADVHKLLPEFLGMDIQGKTVTFIPTASVVEKVNFYVGAAKKAFAQLGMAIDELEISQASKEEIENKLRKNDFIYVSGGNTFYLLQELKRSGADQCIVEQVNAGKVYLGESAGSMIMAKEIAYVKAMDSVKKAPELIDFTALGLVDFYPLPHYQSFPFKKAGDKIMAEYGETLNLLPINNHQAIAVQGEHVQVLSQ